MSPDGDPPQPPAYPPGHGPENRFWSRVWLYWVTGGLAVVLGAAIPVLVQAGSSPGPGPGPTTPVPSPSPSTPSSSPPAPPESTTPPAPPPTAPSPMASTPRVSARVDSVQSLGAVTPTVTKVQVNTTVAGLKGRTVTLKWHTYNDATKLTMSGDSTIGSPVLNWDSTNWHPTFIVPTPTVHWQLQVTVYGPDGTQLATNHSNFTFSTP
ncbi:hypothetical protein AB0K09_05400 [Streptomyces sp. NPDC049577]|uniref:hypothetical protein n=1 Tax=Streptomyces sp. NPDC049577 TaxID=3155153 RepID=UPI003436AD8E